MRNHAHYRASVVQQFTPLTIVACAAALAAPSFAQTILRVDDDVSTAGGNGSTWSTSAGDPNRAFKFLQDALAAAGPIAGGGTSVEIWVAVGTYKPAGPGGSRTATFSLANNVAVYGGFIGTETQLSQRNPSTNITILSGDLNGDDVANFGNNAENSYHVLTGSGTDSTAIVDGFLITGGNSNGPTLYDAGGGILVYPSGGPSINGCTIYRNTAVSNGGGAFISGNSRMSNCRFIQNHGTGAGATGGLDLRGGGGLAVNCVFDSNFAAGIGGGMFSVASNNVINCTFTNNIAPLGGGLAMGGTNIQVINCILWGNTASASGPQLYLYGENSVVTVDYCDVEGSTGAVGRQSGSDVLDWGLNNLNINPQLESILGPDGAGATFDEDFRLRSYSPCIDRGVNSSVPVGVATDFAGNPRIINGDGAGAASVDIGAFEYAGAAFSIPPAAGILYVNQAAAPGGDGTAWASAIKELRDALPIASAIVADGRGPVQVWVAQGTYKSAGPGGSRTATFQLLNNVAIYGGFAGTETLLSQRNVAANVTTLSGDLNGDDTTPSTNGAPPASWNDNVYHVLRGGGVDETAILNGFTITAGNAHGEPPQPGGFEQSAAGMFVWPGGSPTVAKCTFWRNRAVVAAGVWAVDGAITVQDCRFVENVATFSVGALDLENSSDGRTKHVINCEFTGNYSAWNAAALAVKGHASVVNCIFSGNTAVGRSAGIEVVGSPNSIVNSILWGNNAPSAAELYVQAASAVGISFSDVQGGPAAAGLENGSAIVNWLSGNIDAAPLFVDADGADNVSGTLDDDLRLRPYSPCIDHGSNNAIPSGVTTDIAGGARIVDGDGVSPATVDMGDYEYSGPPFSVISGAGVLFVNQALATSGDGVTWASAIKELRDALPIASAIVAGGRGPVQVWVAQGTYKPSPPLFQGGSRSGTFQMTNSVSIYGGFAGTESQLSQRSVAANLTILSGDLNANDLGNLNRSENAYHVVVLSDACEVDGFTIQAGQADDVAPAPQRIGGGMAGNGAGTVRNCVFHNNVASEAGAAVHISNSTPSFENCQFLNNSSGGRGGAVSVTGSSVPVLRYCEFRDNFAGGVPTGLGGGAVSTNLGAAPIFVGCSFIRNSTFGDGGAIQAIDSAVFSCVNCSLFGNVSFGGQGGGGGGAATVRNNSSAYLTNCAIVGNLAVDGGAVFATLENGGTLRIVNSSFVENGVSAPDGQAVHVAGGDITSAMANCILWRNHISNVPTAAAQVRFDNVTPTHCIIWGWSGGPGNFSSDPLFVRNPGPGLSGGWGDGDDDYGDLHPSAGSPAIDSADSFALGFDPLDIDNDGDVSENLPIDLAGLPRYVDDPSAFNTGPGSPPAYVDRGAFEFIADCPSCPGPRRWLRPQNGLFSVSADWTPSIPNSTHEALFDHRGNSWLVDFATVGNPLYDGNPLLNKRLRVSNGNVTFDLRGRTYRLTDTLAPSITIGDGEAGIARLTLQAGTLQGVAARIGSGALTADGALYIPAGTAMSLSRDICIGCDGIGRMEITDGGLVISRDASIGDQVGSNGYVSVRGANSRWSIPLILLIDNGELNIADGGQVVTGFGTFLFNEGRITGNGTIVGDVVNFGEMAPGNSPGTLTILGNYEQVGTIPELGDTSGTLTMQVDGAQAGQYDRLVVEGTATLGGGVFVQSPPGLDLPVNTRLSLVTATGGRDNSSPRFDVGFFPPLASKFMTVEYGASSSAPVELAVSPLPAGVPIQSPNSAPAPGVPSAAAVADLNGDGREDVVLAIPGEPGQPGSVVILTTEFGPGNVYTPRSVQITVGVNPTALALAQFDGSPRVDVAVVNALDGVASGTVMFFSNTGNDGLNRPIMVPQSGATTIVGHNPHGLAAADFDGDSRVDLAVANTNDDAVQLLLHPASNGSPFAPHGPPIGVPPRPQPICPWDPDGDGDYDLVVASGTDLEDGFVTVLSNINPTLHSPGFGDDAGHLQSLRVGRRPVQLGEEDLTRLSNDPSPARPEIMTYNAGDGSVSVLVNTTSAADAVTFAPAVNLPISSTPAQLASVLAVLDLDEDGDEDAAVVVQTPNGLVTRQLRNDLANGQLGFVLDPTALPNGTDPVAVLSGDLNNDGRDDLITIGRTPAPLHGGDDGGVAGSPPPSVIVNLKQPALIAFVAGDLNCDGVVNNFDIDPFVLALVDPSAYAAAFPTCDRLRGDANHDGLMNNFDIDAFVTCILLLGCP